MIDDRFYETDEVANCTHYGTDSETSGYKMRSFSCFTNDFWLDKRNLLDDENILCFNKEEDEFGSRPIKCLVGADEDQNGYGIYTKKSNLGCYSFDLEGRDQYEEAQTPQLDIRVKRMDAGPRSKVQSKHHSDSIMSLKKMEVLLSEPIRCQKELLKQFLIDSFLKEEVSLRRFDHLPSGCKMYVSIFLSEQFSFTIRNQTKSGKPDYGLKEVIKLKNNKLEGLPENKRIQHLKFNSLSFIIEYYLQALRKQLKSSINKKNDRPNLEEDEKQTDVIRVLYRKLFEKGCFSEGESAQQEKDSPLIPELVEEEFIQMINNLIEFRELEDVDELLKKIPRRFIDKLKKIPRDKLLRFYSVKIQKYFNRLIDEMKDVESASKQIFKQTNKIDLLSNYILKQKINTDA